MPSSRDNVSAAMRRGRPPYPDLLTPREQVVLDLLRRGQTNQQIADRLGISLPGARYHVSEILSKLGVGSRQEAAAWQDGMRLAPYRLLVPVFVKLKLLAGGALKAASTVFLVLAGVALFLFAFLVIDMRTRGEGNQEPLSPTETSVETCSAPDDICTRATALEQVLLIRKDFDWVVQNYPPPGFIVCNMDDPYFGPAPPRLCEGAGPSEQRFVYNIGYSIDTASGPLSVEEFKDALHSWVESPSASSGDQYGTAANRLYSVGCKETHPSQLRPACADGFVLVFSKIAANSTQRSHLLLFLEPRENSKVSAFIGPMPETKHLDPALLGGSTTGFFGPASRPATFYAFK
jgi:DNA-binding CsgD family transcriptional regulator